jgi:trans-aconitate 2-methyltransferase
VATEWSPAQYARFERERAQPFHDLKARIPDGDVRSVADLGCGTGQLTPSLRRRWPAARVWGVDSSPQMLEKARASVPSDEVTFVQADLREWVPPAPLDRIVSNAALQWVPDHGPLLARLSGLLAPGGALAVQVPNNRGEPAYCILAELRGQAPWKERLRGAQDLAVESPAWYPQHLARLGLRCELWETIYYHPLAGAGEIVEWMKGTALRPILSALAPADAERFLGLLRARLEAAFPPGPAGVIFPFRRLFFVAQRP